MITRKTIRKCIKTNDFLCIIDIIREDNDNKWGAYLYREIPADEEGDHVFEVYESFYDCSKAYYRYVRGYKRKYQSVEGVKRRIKG